MPLTITEPEVREVLEKHSEHVVKLTWSFGSVEGKLLPRGGGYYNVVVVHGWIGFWSSEVSILQHDDDGGLELHITQRQPPT